MFELIPYARFNNVGRLRRDMDDLWQRFFDHDPEQAKTAEGIYLPMVNITETDEALEVTAEVPGMEPENITVSLNGDVLTIKGEKKEEVNEQRADYHLMERRFGSFQRSFRLPAEVDRDKLKAKNKKGVLKITLPKAAKAGATTIEVQPED